MHEVSRTEGIARIISVSVGCTGIKAPGLEASLSHMSLYSVQLATDVLLKHLSPLGVCIKLC